MFLKKPNPTLIKGEKNYIFISPCNYCVHVSKYIMKNIHLAISELMVTFLLRKKYVIDHWWVKSVINHWWVVIFIHVFKEIIFKHWLINGLVVGLNSPYNSSSDLLTHITPVYLIKRPPNLYYNVKPKFFYFWLTSSCCTT